MLIIFRGDILFDGGRERDRVCTPEWQEQDIAVLRFNSCNYNTRGQKAYDVMLSSYVSRITVEEFLFTLVGAFCVA